MKSRRKKILGLVVFLCLFVFSGKAVLTSYAESGGTCGDNLTWTLSDDGTLTISGTGKMDDCVTSYSQPWHSESDNIKSIVIEDGVTYIGEFMFSWCSFLTSVTIGEGVESIGRSAFSLCSSLESVTIGEGVESIGDSAFYGCTSLESVTIPNSVKTMEYGLFGECANLKSVTIMAENVVWKKNPDYPNDYSEHIFFRCSNLEDVYLAGSKEMWKGLVTDVKNIPRSPDIGYYAGEILPDPDLHYCVFVRAEVDNENLGSVTGAGMYIDNDGEDPEETDITLKATPKEGCAFAGWEKDGQIIHTGDEWTFKYKDACDREQDGTYHYSLKLKAIFKKVLTITANDQSYVYNGEEQGEGDTVYDDPAEIKKKVTVSGGLLDGDSLSQIILFGHRKEIGVYPKEIEVSNAVISRKGQGAPVTDEYKISYVYGTLTIKDNDEPHVHAPKLVEEKEATCTEAGNKTYYKCSCGKWFEDLTANVEITDKSSVIIKALGHNWDEGVVTTEPTETEEGVRTFTCRNDSSHKRTEVIPRKEKRQSSGSRGQGSDSRPPSGAWRHGDDGWYYRENGKLVKNSWHYLAYEGRSYWYYFDESGLMKTGWLELGGSRYYLCAKDGDWLGHMLTDWQEIGGKWYYFETKAGSGQGRMYRNERTPDGFWVGEDGAWDGKPADMGAQGRRGETA